MPYPEDTNRKVNSLQKNMVFFPATEDRDTWFAHDVTALDTVNVITIQIPKGVNAVLVQAIDGDIRYTLTPGADPSQTSGFKLWNGNDPIAIPVLPGMVLSFIAEDAGAILQSQYGRLF